MAMQGVITRFAEEAAFLWLRRCEAVGAPHFRLPDLARLDERVEAHLDGLRVAGEAGWAACRTLMEKDHSALFPAAVVAFDSADEEKVGAVMGRLSDDPSTNRALISALGWLPWLQAEPYVGKLLANRSPIHRYLAIAASAAHRRDPGMHLEAALHDSAPFLKSRALLAHGELGRSRALPALVIRHALAAGEAGTRFAAAWSGALAGNAEALEGLREFVLAQCPYHGGALSLILRCLDRSAALSYHKYLAAAPDTVRLAVVGAGFIGDPLLVPWLVEQMRAPALARAAGEAFTMITGIDLVNEELHGSCPDGFHGGPNGDPRDDNVTPDPDRDLPWPEPAGVATWWSRNEGAYRVGVRHLLGKAVSPHHLRHVLGTGAQRQRAAAAVELALIYPDQPLYNVRAPGFRQRDCGGGR